VDCSVLDLYDFQELSAFTSGQSGWYAYADNTPGGIPDLKTGKTPDGEDDPAIDGSNVAIQPLTPPRCGDASGVELRASGHNFYGAGFGDYQHNDPSQRIPGTGYDGLSFWARSPGNTDKTFMLTVDDGHTVNLQPPTNTAPMGDDQDLDGDGVMGPGDIVAGTTCHLPPPQDVSRPSCYYGGTLPPATPARVPEANECGNQFHTYITTTENWQLYLVPWSQLVQWPCPNRLDGGIDPADIAKVEIKFVQGSNYDVWLDNISFYRPRTGAGP
jgi:hypothetical protein